MTGNTKNPGISRGMMTASRCIQPKCGSLLKEFPPKMPLKNAGFRGLFDEHLVPFHGKMPLKSEFCLHAPAEKLVDLINSMKRMAAFIIREKCSW